jgi:hypothetical protein
MKLVMITHDKRLFDLLVAGRMIFNLGNKNCKLESLLAFAISYRNHQKEE